MWILSILLILSGILCADPFYYGDSAENSSELRLYGIMNNSANINGEWIKMNRDFYYEDKTFKLAAIQGRCAILLNEENDEIKICLKPTRIIKEAK